MKEITIVN